MPVTAIDFLSDDTEDRRRERARERWRRYRKNNPDVADQANRRYKAAHPEKVAQWKAASYQRHREEIEARRKAKHAADIADIHERASRQGTRTDLTNGTSNKRALEVAPNVVAAKAVGMSRPTADKALKVVKAIAQAPRTSTPRLPKARLALSDGSRREVKASKLRFAGVAEPRESPRSSPVAAVAPVNGVVAGVAKTEAGETCQRCGRQTVERRQFGAVCRSCRWSRIA